MAAEDETDRAGGAPAGPPAGRRARSAAAGWLTAAAVIAVLAVNAAGLWSIAAARRGVREEAGRLFRARTEAEARAIESRVSATRTDLAFLAGSSAVSRLGDGAQRGERARAAAEGAEEGGEADWSRRAAEAALLVFLRGHPEVKHLERKNAKGRPHFQSEEYADREQERTHHVATPRARA